MSSIRFVDTHKERDAMMAAKVMRYDAALKEFMPVVQLSDAGAFNSDARVAEELHVWLAELVCEEAAEGILERFNQIRDPEDVAKLREYMLGLCLGLRLADARTGEELKHRSTVITRVENASQQLLRGNRG
jgi:hypothetical protein